MAEIAGLKLIVPSSVAGSGVSVSASGKVTFTAATSVSVNGCFTSTYDNYLVVIRHLAASGNPAINARLRASGTDASGSNYAWQVLEATTTSVTGERQTSLTSGRFGLSTDGNRSGDHVYVYGPALAQPTAMRNVSVNGGGGARIFDYACTHSLSTAYDGFTLLPATSNLTGALCVYGLSQ